MTEPVIQTPRPVPNGQPPKDAAAADRKVSHSEYERESPPGVPRWVKLLGIAVVVLGLFFGAMHLTGNGGGPGSHFAEHGISMP
jgi:hypothetical protein